MEKFLTREKGWKAVSYEAIMQRNSQTNKERGKIPCGKKPSRETLNAFKLGCKNQAERHCNEVLKSLPILNNEIQPSPSWKLDCGTSSSSLNCEVPIEVHNAETATKANQQIGLDSSTYNKTRRNSIMTRIQRDLNSPSASSRVRALKALKNPIGSSYSQFDIHLSEQNIILDEERNAPLPAPSLPELMKDIVIYVEVRSGEDNRSEGVKKVISALGARINNKLLRGTTHVIFKDGLLSTYKKAKTWNIPIVSILWIEACKKQFKICDPKDFTISNIERYEYPELYEKIKRYKPMQPDSECNKRVRTRPATPKTSTPRNHSLYATPTSSKKQKTDISHYFRQLNDNSLLENGETLKCLTPTSNTQNKKINLPPTMRLNRISFDHIINDDGNNIESIQDLAEMSENSLCNVHNNRNETEHTSDKNGKSNIDTLNDYSAKQIYREPEKLSDGSIGQVPEPDKPLNGIKTRRHSFMNAITNITKEGSLSRRTERGVSPCKTTRRRSTIERNVDISLEILPDDTNELKKLKTRLSNCAPILEERSTNENSENPSKPDIPLSKSNHKRRTTFTTKPLETSECTTLASTRRRTLYTPQTMEESTVTGADCGITTVEEEEKDNFINVNKSENTPRSENLLMQVIDTPPTPMIFNSVRQPGLRRTLFDVSMDIIAHRMQNINQSARRSITSIAEYVSCTSDIHITPKNTVSTTNEKASDNGDSGKTSNNVISANIPKKRKLFMPSDSFQFDTPKKFPRIGSSATKRRRSHVPHSTNPKLTSTGRRLGSNSFDISKSANGERYHKGKTEKQKFMAYTNMHKEQIEIIKKAISKLGTFVLEDNVSNRTTHLISLEPRRTLNLLRGLVRGTWILNFNWISQSLHDGHWLNEELFELSNFSRAIEICRTERQAFGAAYKCQLFTDVGPFYVPAQCFPISKEDMKDLIALCGGKITAHRKNAKLILMSNKDNNVESDKICISPYWILDSISQMQLQKMQKYNWNSMHSNHHLLKKKPQELPASQTLVAPSQI